MGISSLAGTNLTPTKPRTATLSQASSVSGTYYTVLNITSGRGQLSRVLVNGELTTYVLNQNLNIRITVDNDTAYVISGSSTVGLGWLRGNNQGNYVTSGANYTPTSTYNCYYNANVFYKQSLKVEVMQNNTTGVNLNSVVDYVIE